MIASGKQSEAPSIEQRGKDGDVKKSHTDKLKTSKDKDLKEKEGSKTQPLNFYQPSEGSSENLQGKSVEDNNNDSGEIIYQQEKKPKDNSSNRMSQ